MLENENIDTFKSIPRRFQRAVQPALLNYRI